MTIAVRPTTIAGDLFDLRTLEALRAQLDGDLITPERPEYDKARQVQDIAVDRYPLAIVRAASARDVAAAVQVAAAHALPLAVRGGGHSLARLSMADDALVIDLSAMRGISIDPETRIARVQGGVTSGDLAGPAGEHGLALTTGDTATVGFGGLASGGGLGFMARKYGMTIDNLLSAQVVTAAGEIVTASPNEHPDLFWAIRGGGGNFGVITEFTLRLAEVPQILGGVLLLPATREVLRGYLEYTATAPDELSTIANLMLGAPFPYTPEEWYGKPVVMVIVCWSGDLEAGERAIAPLRALAEPIADTIAPGPYSSIYDWTAHQEVRHSFSLRSMYANELSDAALDAALEAIANASSPYSLIHLRGLGGALNRVMPDATAYAHRHQRYMYTIIGLWMDADEDPEPHSAWTLSLWEKVRHEGDGVYVNFLQNEGPERVRDAYPPATYARLREIKRRYDPTNLFRLNQNISPAG
ncbi:MAG: FAD-linked oxidase [Chloroflexi bacterium]|nr:MAG: FAD-linked oxidase [Chloroflexota bacterium]